MGPCPEGYVRYGDHLPKGNLKPGGVTEARRLAGFDVGTVYDRCIPDILDIPQKPEVPTAGHPSNVKNNEDSSMTYLR